MSKAVSTIVTWDYIDRAIVTLESMRRNGPEQEFYIFVIDDSENFDKMKSLLIERNGIHLIGWEDIPEELKEAKVSYTSDILRWAMKPFVIEFLLQSHQKVLMVDCDLYFVSRFDFLYDFEGFELTPHWRPMSPEDDDMQFQMMFQHGYFNAGFVGFSQSGLPAAKWWQEVCMWKCEANSELGLYVDQKYLDYMPYHFPDLANIVEHQGCNIAFWNARTNRRKLLDNGEIVINNEYPAVFIHFTQPTLGEGILSEYSNPYQSEIEQVQNWIESNEISLEKSIKFWCLYELINEEWIGPVNERIYSEDEARSVLNRKMGNGRRYKITPLERMF